MADSISVAMLGASGRMGQSIIPLLAADAGGLRLSGALVAPGDNAIGQDAGSFAGAAPLAIAITDDPRRALAGASVAIDFTLAEASVRNAALCRELDVPLVIGTTGHSGAQLAEVEEIARGLPVVLAAFRLMNQPLLPSASADGVVQVDPEVKSSITVVSSRFTGRPVVANESTSM